MLSSSSLRILILVLLLQAASPFAVLAEHPIDVQQLAAKGDYYGSLVAYTRIPERQNTLEATLAAAKSAWALSLPRFAMESYDEAIQHYALTDEDTAKIYISKGIIQFQEHEYQVSAWYAERAVNLLKEESSLRARAWLLWGESLMKSKNYTAAKDKFDRAIGEIEPDQLGEASFLLGRCLIAMGRPEEARESLEHIPQNDERTPEAIRYLIEIAVEGERLSDAEYWLNFAVSNFPEKFLDGWVDFMRISAASKAGKLSEVRKLRQQASKKLPPSSNWLALIDATAEALEWKHASQAKVAHGNE